MLITGQIGAGKINLLISDSRLFCLFLVEVTIEKSPISYFKSFTRYQILVMYDVEIMVILLQKSKCYFRSSYLTKGVDHECIIFFFTSTLWLKRNAIHTSSTRTIFCDIFFSQKMQGSTRFCTRRLPCMPLKQ